MLWVQNLNKRFFMNIKQLNNLNIYLKKQRIILDYPRGEKHEHTRIPKNCFFQYFKNKVNFSDSY